MIAVPASCAHLLVPTALIDGDELNGSWRQWALRPASTHADEDRCGQKCAGRHMAPPHAAGLLVPLLAAVAAGSFWRQGFSWRSLAAPKSATGSCTGHLHAGAAAAVARHRWRAGLQRRSHGAVALAERLKTPARRRRPAGPCWAAATVVMQRHSRRCDRAQERAWPSQPQDAQTHADLGDALAFVAGRRFDGEPERLIQRALQLDPRNAKALELAGTLGL